MCLNESGSAFLAAHHRSCCDVFLQDQLDDLQRHKALWIWKWARDAGVKASKDEVAEMVLQDCLTAELQQLWERGRTQQKLVIQLCDTVVDGSPEGLAVNSGPGCAQRSFAMWSMEASVHRASLCIEWDTMR